MQYLASISLLFILSPAQDFGGGFQSCSDTVPCPTGQTCNTLSSASGTISICSTVEIPEVTGTGALSCNCETNADCETGETCTDVSSFSGFPCKICSGGFDVTGWTVPTSVTCEDQCPCPSGQECITSTAVGGVSLTLPCSVCVPEPAATSGDTTTEDPGTEEDTTTEAAEDETTTEDPGTEDETTTEAAEDDTTTEAAEETEEPTPGSGTTEEEDNGDDLCDLDPDDWCVGTPDGCAMTPSVVAAANQADKNDLCSLCLKTATDGDGSLCECATLFKEQMGNWYNEITQNLVNMVMTHCVPDCPSVAKVSVIGTECSCASLDCGLGPGSGAYEYHIGLSVLIVFMLYIVA